MVSVIFIAYMRVCLCVCLYVIFSCFVRLIPGINVPPVGLYIISFVSLSQNSEIGSPDDAPCAMIMILEEQFMYFVYYNISP